MVYDRWEHAGVIVEIVHDDDARSPQENDNAGTLYSWDRWFKGDEQIRRPDMEILCPTCKGEAYVPTRYWPGAKWDECLRCNNNGFLVVDYAARFAEHYDSVLTIPLWYDEGRGDVASIYESDDPNCALVFTQEEIDREWDGHLDPYQVHMKWRSGDLTGEVREYGGARSYAKGRIKELDDYLQGNVWGIVIRAPLVDHEHCVEVGSCWAQGTSAPTCDDRGKVLESCWGFIGETQSDWIRKEAEEMAVIAALALKEEADEVAYWAARDVVTV